MPSVPSVIKQPGESRLYPMEFAALLVEGETISGIDSITKDKTTTPDLVIAEQAYSGSIVQFRVSGGVDGTKYKITVRVDTTAGNLIEGEGIIQCEDL